MTGRLSNQQKISKSSYKFQQNGELKSGIPVTAPTQMGVHKGQKTLFFSHIKNIIYLSNLVVS